MEMIRCPRCAKEVPDVSRFCRRCGSALAWRTTLSPSVLIPSFSQRDNPARTLIPPRPARKAQAAMTTTTTRKTCAGDGSGAFALLAAVGMLFFLKSFALRTVSLPPSPPSSVRYQFPALPALPSSSRPPRVSPPVSYPIPLRSNTPGAVSPPLPPGPPGSIIVVEPPAAPWPWEVDEYGRPPRVRRSGTNESTAPNRSGRVPAER